MRDLIIDSSGGGGGGLGLGKKINPKCRNGGLEGSSLNPWGPVV